LASAKIHTTLASLVETLSDPMTIAQMAHYVPPTKPGILKVLFSNPLCHTPAALSYLSDAGCHILSCISVFSRTL
jgi:hypothetical protein